MQVVMLIFSLLLPAQHIHHPPQGWLDCGFEQGVYECRP